MRKADMKVYVGEPGTGKSHQLIEDAIEIVKRGEELFIMTPSDKAKQRLISGINERLHYPFDKEIMFQLIGSVHVTGKNYHREANILIDEISMVTLTEFRAILFQTLNDDIPRQLLTYGDIKQLPSVKDHGVLETLLRANSEKFPSVVKNFWSWVASDCYSSIQPSQLKVPSEWNKAIETIEIKALKQNYRLKKLGDGSITNFGDEFYEDLFQQYVSQDYTKELVASIEEDYLIIAPTYPRGQEADRKIFEYFGAKEQCHVAPFVRSKDKRTDVYLNPECDHFETLRKEFDFMRTFSPNDDIRKFEYSCFITIHSVQGGQVSKVCVYLGEEPIRSQHREHYNKNLLYTAVTRAGKCWRLLGERGEFEQMRNINPQDPKIISNNICNTEALETTMNTVIEMNDKKLSYEEVYDLFKKNYKYYASKVEYEVAEPYKQKTIINCFREDIHNKWFSKLPSVYNGYYFTFVKQELERGNALGGKNKTGRGKNQKKYLALSPKEKQRFKADKSSRKVSKEKFYADWGMTKDQARAVLKAL